MPYRIIQISDQPADHHKFVSKLFAVLKHFKMYDNYSNAMYMYFIVKNIKTATD